MNSEQQQELFEEKYEKKLGISYQDWIERAPETEDQAYEKLAELNTEIEQLNDVIANTPSDAREELEDERGALKLEYSLIEEMFGLELDD